MATLLVPFLTVRAAASAEAAGPVSGAIGLGDGLSGSVDERTGLFSASVPLVTVGGPGSAGVTWSLLWDQGRAVDGLDRSGFGAGLVAGRVVHRPGDAGDGVPGQRWRVPGGRDYPSGLENYPLQDLVYAKTAGCLPVHPDL